MFFASLLTEKKSGMKSNTLSLCSLLAGLIAAPLLSGCEGAQADAALRSAEVIGPNANAIYVMEKFLGLDASGTHGRPVIQRQGVSLSGQGACSASVRRVREPAGDGVALEIMVRETLAVGVTNEIQFRVWSFEPSKRDWSQRRSVGSIVRRPVDVHLNGMALTASVRTDSFDENTLLLTKKSYAQELAMRKSNQGGLEITLKSGDSGMLANLASLISKPNTVSCRFNESNV